MAKQEIIVVEDEVKIAQLLDDYLSEAGYTVTKVSKGDHAVKIIKDKMPACVILDVMLPGKDGLSICREVRQFSTLPIVMITARVDEIDRLLGLELGADDYICKPFSPREVVVRIRNILRRVALTSPTSASPQQPYVGLAALPNKKIKYRNLSLDLERFKCHLNDRPVILTAVEFRMLFVMSARPGCIFSRNQLMNAAYTDERVVSDRTIDTHIKNLRKKLALTINLDQPNEELIHSVYGVGYKLE